MCLSTGSASAQDADLLTEPRLLDQGINDIGPLGTSLRQVPLDLRVPSGFDRVYELPGLPGAEPTFARFDGGVAALFSRSDYAATANGPLALIPPGTVFVIGGTDELLGVDDNRRPSELGRLQRRDLRAQTPLFPPGVPSFARAAPDWHYPWGDDRGRARRVGGLIRSLAD